MITPDRISGSGNLPRDIRIQQKQVPFYFPMTTMILAGMIIRFLSGIAGKFLLS
ncbi:MAG: DUF2905 family protein [Bacteroidales bacterium]